MSTMNVTRRGPTFRQIKVAVDRKLRDVSFAHVVALTKTAQKIKPAEVAEMRRVFDRPTPWTLNSVFMEPATKQKPWARVWLKDDWSGIGWGSSKRKRGSKVNKGSAAAGYLLPQIRGGDRPAKSGEYLLRSRGFIGRDEFVVPATRVQDQYGNIRKGLMTRILSDLGAQLDPWSNRPGTTSRIVAEMGQGGPISKAKKGRYFVATIKGTKAVWERTSKGIAPVLIVIRRPTYFKRYDFLGVARASFATHWSSELRSAMAKYGAGKPRRTQR